VFGAVCAACVVVVTNVRDRTMTKTLAGLAGVLFFVASIAHHLLDTCDDFLRLYLVTREGAKVALPFDLGGATSAVRTSASEDVTPTRTVCSRRPGLRRV
jgi:hypothetical protein